MTQGWVLVGKGGRGHESHTGDSEHKLTSKKAAAWVLQPDSLEPVPTLAQALT